MLKRGDLVRVKEDSWRERYHPGLGLVISDLASDMFEIYWLKQRKLLKWQGSKHLLKLNTDRTSSEEI